MLKNAIVLSTVFTPKVFHKMKMKKAFTDVLS